MPLPLLTSQYLVEEWTQVFLNITFFSLFCPGWFWFQNGIIPHPPTTHPINHNNDTEVGLHRKEIFCDGGADLEWQFVWRSGFLILCCIAPPFAQNIFICCCKCTVTNYDGDHNIANVRILWRSSGIWL